MIYAPSGLILPISQKEGSVNTFLQKVSAGYNAQNKEFVNRTIKDFIEKNLILMHRLFCLSIGLSKILLKKILNPKHKTHWLSIGF